MGKNASRKHPAHHRAAAIANLHSETASKDSNKRTNMKQKGHPQQHHHHHPMIAEPSSLLGPTSGNANDDGAGDVDRSLQSPPTIGVHFIAPEEDDVAKNNKNDRYGRQQQPPPPSR